jgi:hypothetical protein
MISGAYPVLASIFGANHPCTNFVADSSLHLPMRDESSNVLLPLSFSSKQRPGDREAQLVRVLQ